MASSIFSAVKADEMTGATSSSPGVSGLVPAPAAGDDEKYLKGDGTWGVVRSDVSTAFTDVNFSIAIADWTTVTGGFKAIIQNSAFTATSKLWYFLNADYYENAPAPFNFEVVAGGVEVTTETKPIGIVSGMFRTVESIPITDATEQVLAGTLRVVPFSIGVTDWVLGNGQYKCNKQTEHVTLSSVEFVEYSSSFRSAIRGDIEAAKTPGGGGVTFITNAKPVGILTGEIRVFDRNDGKVAIITQATELPTMRDVPFTVEVSDWAINASGKYEAVFETAYVTATSHDFVEFDESIENATDGIKVIKAEYNGEVIGLKFVSRRIPAGDISGIVTPLDNADGKIAVALQDTVMPIANGGTGANTLQGAQDALGITELRESFGFKTLWTGDVYDTNTHILADSILNYDFLLAEGIFNGDNYPIVGTSLVNVQDLYTSHGKYLWIDGGANDRSFTLIFNNDTTMHLDRRASTSDGICAIYGFKFPKLT